MGAGMRRMMRVKMVTSIERTEFCYTFVAYGFFTNFIFLVRYMERSHGLDEYGCTWSWLPFCRILDTPMFFLYHVAAAERRRMK